MRFVPTHTIVTYGRVTYVRLDADKRGNGPLYTEQEWDTATAADWELVGGGLCFHGMPRLATLSAIPADDKAACLARYEAMVAHPRAHLIPAAAWRGLAGRLEMNAFNAGGDLGRKYHDRVADCVERAGRYEGVVRRAAAHLKATIATY